MQKLRISNFRKIKDLEIDVSAVTFLTGKNNSGKSSIIKALLLLEDYANQKDQLSLSFQAGNRKFHQLRRFDEAVRMGEKAFSIEYEIGEYRYILSFVNKDVFTGGLKFFAIYTLAEEVLFKLEVSSQITASVDHDLLKKKAKQESSSFDESNLMETLGDLREHQKQLEERLKSDLSSSERIHINDDLKKAKKTVAEISKKLNRESREILKGTVSKKDATVNGADLPSIAKTCLIKALQQQITSRKENIPNYELEDKMLQDFLEGLTEKGLSFSLRPSSISRFRPLPAYSETDGDSEFAVSIKEYFQNKLQGNSKESKFLHKWLEEFGIGNELKVDHLNDAAYSISLLKDKEVLGDLTNLGYGSGQLIAVLLSIINAAVQKQNSQSSVLLLLEEPEANLHPDFQAKLAEMFFSAWKNLDVQLIVETHSEYLVRNSQLLIKESRDQINFSEEDLRNIFHLYYLDSMGSGYEMRYRQDGIFENDFGPGFMDITRKIARKLL